MHKPFFSVVICNYNLADYVCEAVESVLNQDYPQDLREVVVVDDGSTDDSLGRLSAFRDRPEVTVIRQANAGQAAALGTGVAQAQGDYVCLLDSDDWFLPHKLARLADVLAAQELAGDVALMHDYAVYDQRRQMELEPSWFATLPGPLGAAADLADPAASVRVPIPCGQVYSRPLIQHLCEGIPNADFRYGADVVIGHGAFLAARRLTYLNEPLAVYRVHGRNEMAGIGADGRYTAKNAIAGLGRWPKQIRYFENLVDGLPGDAAARQDRLAYLGRLARSMHSTSAARGLRAPRLTFIVLDDTDGAALEQTLRSIAAQTYAAIETVLVSADRGRAANAAGPVDRVVEVPRGSSRLAWLGSGYAAAGGDFLAFVPAGDRPDPVFAERLVHVLQYGTPAMQAVSDIRIVDDQGTLLQSSPFYAGGEWRKAVDYLPPLKTAMPETLFPPVAAGVIRRSRFLEPLFALSESVLAASLGSQAEWLVQQFAHAMGGTTRLSECLVSHRVGGGAEAAWSIRTSAREPDGRAAVEPDLHAAVQLMLSAYSGAHAEFRQVFPETWHAEFVAWLNHAQPPETTHALRAIAAGLGDAETVELIDALAELP